MALGLFLLGLLIAYLVFVMMDSRHSGPEIPPSGVLYTTRKSPNLEEHLFYEEFDSCKTDEQVINLLSRYIRRNL